MVVAVEIERELHSLTERLRAAQRVWGTLERQRNLAIREARMQGISQQRVMDLTGLSRARIHQIVRSS